MKIDDLLGTGRIGEILTALKEVHGVKSTRELSERIKLDALLTALQLEPNDLDDIIADNSPVFRTIKGHAFEIVFEYLVASTGNEVADVGGDSAIDLIVNKYKLQLKTPYAAGTKDDIVQYKTHKTHGAKSELESMDYYHHVQEFADYLVGLISYEPLNIIFLNKDELPRHPKSPEHILSPFFIRWKNHAGLNNYERIGIQKPDASNLTFFPKNIDLELLPKSAKRLNLTTNIILDTILFNSNFRIWDMAIRGWAREIAINKTLRKNGVTIFSPTKIKKSRGDKSDFTLKRKQGGYHFFQVKGVSTNNCSFNGRYSIVATETQLTRGRVNDHPTQSRLYLKSDFEFLILCIDPALSKRFNKEIGKNDELKWQFYLIPTEELEQHHKLSNRLKSLQSFNILTIEKYRMDEETLSQYL